MSMFADARNDDIYNADFLDDKSAEFVRGYDCCIEQMKSLYNGNLDIYAYDLNNVYDESMGEPDEDEVYSKRADLCQILKENAELISLVNESWLECGRDEWVTGLIDDMDEDEYKVNRAKALEDKDKEYYDTIHFAIKGVKRIREVCG